jgi:predicted lipoprotein with Yx(FWY)xxD motif
MKTVRRIVAFSLIVVAALAIAPVASIFAADAEPKDVVLTGEPVDMNCYLTGKSGAGHASCATACANKGNPIGLVVKDGDKSVLYLVLGGGGKASKDLMAAHMGAVVEVSGTAAKVDGMNILTASKVTAKS